MSFPFDEKEDVTSSSQYILKALQTSPSLSRSLLSILSSLSYSLVVVDPITFQVLYHDTHAVQLYQYSAEEFDLQPYYVLYDAPWDKVSRMLTPLQQNTQKHLFTKQKRKDGSRFTAEVFIIPFSSEGRKLCFVFSRNRSEEKTSEVTLTESAHRYKTLFLNMSYPYAYLECHKNEQHLIQDCSVIEVNREFEKMVSRKEADIVGKTLLDIIPELGQLTSPWKEYLKKVLIDKEKVSFEVTMEMFQRYYLATLYPISETLLASIFEDITSQKRLDRLRNSFVNTLTHEIRTPLTAIKAGMEIWMKNPDSPLVKQENLPNMIQNNVMRLITLINQVLDYQKIDHQPFDEFYTQQSINKLIVEIVSQLQNTFEEKNIQLQLDLDDSIQKSWFYKDKISQVLINLINNAVKFTNYGKISVSSCLKRNVIEIKVSDTGIGIDQESQKKLFDTFFQVNPSNKNSAGLGLPLSRKIVERHGGTIWVESKPFQGSSFYFTIPYETQGKFSNHA